GGHMEHSFPGVAGSRRQLSIDQKSCKRREIGRGSVSPATRNVILSRRRRISNSHGTGGDSSPSAQNDIIGCFNLTQYGRLLALCFPGAFAIGNALLLGGVGVLGVIDGGRLAPRSRDTEEQRRAGTHGRAEGSVSVAP